MLTRLLAYLQKLKYLLKRIDSNLPIQTHLRLLRLTHLRSLKRIGWSLLTLTGWRWLKRTDSSLPMMTHLHSMMQIDSNLRMLTHLSLPKRIDSSLLKRIG